MSLDWEKIDILSKILLGTAGLALSGVLAFGQFTDHKREHEQKDAELVSAKEENYKSEFNEFYKSARTNAGNDPLAKSDLDIASSIAQTLANEPFGKTYYADAVQALRAKFVVSSDVVNIEKMNIAKLQSQESQTSKGIQVNIDEWFAVVASYPHNEQGLALAKQLASQFSTKVGCREVWETAVSPVYAVVIGGKSDRTTALQNAQLARLTGFASDAFTQVNKSWTQLTKCPVPS